MPQRAASQHAARQEEPEEIFEEIIEEFDIDEEEAPSLSRSSSKSSRSVPMPIGASSRPAKVTAAPGDERTTSSRKTKTRTKRTDD
jgi:hypothetical protein